MDMSDQYNTPLNTYDQLLFQQKFGTDSTFDYDMQGWYKANPDASPHTGAHYPDTFKKPNHPTFSDESIYHGVDGNQGGHWNSDPDGAEQFIPGKTNLDMHGAEGLQKYFDNNEQSIQLVLPPSN
jgi:hypothetical protein